MLASVDWGNPDWIIAAIAIVGGAVAFIRWVRDGGKRDVKLDDALLQLAALTKKVTPNGRDSQELGDIAARTETKLDLLTERFNTHLGHSDAVERELFHRVGQLERR